MATIGRDRLDWHGTPTLFSIEQLNRMGGSAVDLIHLAWPDAPADVLETHDVTIAIDAPLGFPDLFARVVTTEDAPMVPTSGFYENRWPFERPIAGSITPLENGRCPLRSTNSAIMPSPPLSKLEDGRNDTVSRYRRSKARIEPAARSSRCIRRSSSDRTAAGECATSQSSDSSRRASSQGRISTMPRSVASWQRPSPWTVLKPSVSCRRSSRRQKTSQDRHSGQKAGSIRRRLNGLQR